MTPVPEFQQCFFAVELFHTTMKNIMAKAMLKQQIANTVYSFAVITKNECVLIPYFTQQPEQVIEFIGSCCSYFLQL
ncbi:hypothetical protein D3C85_1428810 [compost metagenome]